ncbi:unnamed protein product [Orchesella dallaii]|uniref:Uncharacterized protein n=1 Tax=Orchesella dallaii TaxID=48710 RepID=A0ABP1QQY7_9HEXA
MLPLKYVPVYFLLLAISISGIAGNASPAGHPAPTLNQTKCAICDSLQAPVCSNDTALLAGNNFTMECELPRVWCFKSEGNITTKDHHGHTISVKKTERGCTNSRNNEECVRVKQQDGSDFKVCYCKNKTCNIDYDISMLTPKNPNTAGWARNSPSWTMCLLLYTSHLVAKYIRNSAT